MRSSVPDRLPTATTPRVAVVIACFDDPLVTEAVASLTDQEPHELVIVDDGSTDPGTRRVLEGLEAGGHTVVRRDNGGLAAARMTGVAATRAPYIYPLDSDDRLAPGALERLADALARDEGAGFAYGDYAIFGDWSGVFRCPERFSPWTLLYADPYGSCSMIRRVALEEAGGWMRGIGYDDWDLWLSLVELGWRGVHAGGIAYERRVHRDRLLASWRRDHRKHVRMLALRHAELFSRDGRRRLREDEKPSLPRRVFYPLGARCRYYMPPGMEAMLMRALVKMRTPF